MSALRVIVIINVIILCVTQQIIELHQPLGMPTFPSFI